MTEILKSDFFNIINTYLLDNNIEFIYDSSVFDFNYVESIINNRPSLESFIIEIPNQDVVISINKSKVICGVPVKEMYFEYYIETDVKNPESINYDTHFSETSMYIDGIEVCNDILIDNFKQTILELLLKYEMINYILK